MRSDGSRERHHVPLAGSPGTTPDGYLAPGVVHLATTDPSGPFAINVVTVDLAASSKIDVALALDVLPGQETTSSMARRRGATVAVNGDYVHPTGAPDLAALEPGDQVTVAWSFAAWPGILETSGGNPTLVRNGRVLSGNVDGTTPFHRRNPRTAVGATADGRLLIVTVDGRQPGHSVGMSLRELAELFVGLGARSAINLDGGGSTTMVIDGTIVNRISDPQERRVPTALLVLRAAPAVPPVEAALAPEAEAAGQRADLDAAAADPGSTGGLLRWLAARDPG